MGICLIHCKTHWILFLALIGYMTLRGTLDLYKHEVVFFVFVFLMFKSRSSTCLGGCGED